MMCYEKCCRLCLKDLVGPGIDCTSIVEIRDAISILFDVKISRSDTTRCICNKCFENVMTFKAFKKTVTECQTIIKDYETIKKKILECRAISIKEEIIDLSDSENPVTGNKVKRKRQLTNPVTDSQINDILNMVHDNPSIKNSVKNNSHNSNKKSRIAVASTGLQPVAVKTESNANTLPAPSVSENRCLRSVTAISCTSKDKNKDVLNNDKRSDSLCSTSTSGIGSSLDTSKVIVKKEPESTTSQITQSNDSNIEAVSSSVPTPVDEYGTNESSSLLNTVSTSVSKNIDVNNKTTNEQYNLNLNTNPSEKPDVTQNGVTSKLNCNFCPAQFLIQKDYETHLQKHNINEENEKQFPKNKQINKIKEEHSVSSSEEEVKAPLTRGRSSRQAKTQALKKLGTPPKRRFSGSPASLKKLRSGTKTPNTLAGSPISFDNLANKKQKESSISGNIAKSIPDLQHKDGFIPKKKRVITITLLKTKESVNFKYCDQYKNIIEFETITFEELEDIRNSLMIPEIWNNLTNVFKTSPPDDKTIEQLKNIFGDKFRI